MKFYCVRADRSLTLSVLVLCGHHCVPLTFSPCETENWTPERKTPAAPSRLALTALNVEPQLWSACERLIFLSTSSRCLHLSITGHLTCV